VAQYYDSPSYGMGSVSTLPPAPPPPPTAAAPDPYAFSDGGPDTGYDPPGYPSGPGGDYDSGSPMLSYGFLEGRYHYSNPRNNDLDGAHGILAALSVELFKPLFVRVGFGWSASSGKDDSFDYDLATGSLGLGAYLPIGGVFHLVIEGGGSYGRLSADSDKFSYSDGALYIRPALRIAPVDYFEFQAGLNLTSSDEFDSYTVDLSAFFRLIGVLDLALGVDLGEEFTGFTGGLRVRW
jgi:hypothetical protein